MSIERAVLLLAGSMVLIALLLAWLVSPWWMLLAAFVGANLFQSALTGFCPAARIFAALGLRHGATFR
jgi:hypothetical protein